MSFYGSQLWNDEHASAWRPCTLRGENVLDEYQNSIQYPQ